MIFRSPKEPPKLNPGSPLGFAALEVAVEELGRGEAGGNNYGPDVVRYRRGIDDGGPWCADFVSWCFLEGAKRLGLTVQFRVSRSARRLCARIARAGFVVTTPRPGDVFLLSRGLAGSRKGHTGFVEHLQPDGATFTTIEGNRGAYPSKVGQFERRLGDGDLILIARAPL